MSPLSSKHSPRTLLIFSLILLVALLAGCGPREATVIPPTPAEASVQPSPTTAVPPSPTPEPARALLMAPAGAEARTQAAQAVLSEAAGGLQVETKSEITPGDLTAGVKLVVLLETPPNLEQLLSAAPGTQFVVISGADVAAKGENLSVIRVRPEAQAFLAGYTAELVTSDWRAGGLLPSEELSNAFLSGGRYWCGRCTPIYPPLVIFPLAGTVPPGSDVGTWAAAYNELQAKVLEVVYLSPEATSPELINALVDQKIRIVGSQPPPVETKAVWVATIQMDELASLRELLPDLLAGQGGKTVNAALTVSDVNEDILTTGRLRLVEETRDALEQGLLGTQPVP